jgi:hypothetical protein
MKRKKEDYKSGVFCSTSYAFQTKKISHFSTYSNFACIFQKKHPLVMKYMNY